MLSLLSDDFYEDTFFSFTIEFTIKYLLPWSKIEFAFSDSYNYFPSHDASLKVSIGIILVAIMTVLRVRLFGSEFFEPNFKVVMQARFVVIDKDAGGYVHGITEDKAFFYAALGETCLDLWGDVDEFSPASRIEPELFSVAFHKVGSLIGTYVQFVRLPELLRRGSAT